MVEYIDEPMCLFEISFDLESDVHRLLQTALAMAFLSD